MKIVFLIILTLLSGFATIAHWLLRQQHFAKKQGKKVLLLTVLYIIMPLLLFFYHPDSTPVGLLYLLIISSLSIVYKDYKNIFIDKKTAFSFSTFLLLIFSLIASVYMIFKEFS